MGSCTAISGMACSYSALDCTSYEMRTQTTRESQQDDRQPSQRAVHDCHDRILCRLRRTRLQQLLLPGTEPPPHLLNVQIRQSWGQQGYQYNGTVQQRLYGLPFWTQSDVATTTATTSTTMVDDLDIMPSSPGAIEDNIRIVHHICMKAWALPMLNNNSCDCLYNVEKWKACSIVMNR